MSTGPMRLGRYELIRLLGEGGMGRVWEADLCGPAGFRKRVALKVLKSGGTGLAHEARLGGLLRHTNLVEVYELGVERDGGQETWFCAMELVPGRVADHVPMPVSAALDVIRQAAAGLAHAAEQIGLVHLDLKPANLLLDDGVVKVADLGISRAYGFVRGERIQGTPAYMSPEQRAGGVVDGRSDVFSLGVVLIALVRGKPSTDPAGLNGLESLLGRCLHEDPNRRYRSVADLASALESMQVDGPRLHELMHATVTSTRSSSITTQTSHTYSFPAEAPTRQTNLGPEPDAFVGRQALIDDLLERTSQPGLVTLKGMGGLGKTRLSMQVARRWHASHGMPAWFCDLSECTSEAEALAVMARTLELSGGRDDLEELATRVGAAMSSGPILVVLDNLEQLPAAVELVAGWLGQAPELRIVATSRELLRVRGETVIELHPLTDEEAVELLAARVKARGHDIEIDDDLRELARRLDGIPLALELASGRLSMLSAGQVLERLGQRLKLLSRGRRGAPARQATLRGAIDWSWDLLDEHERTAFVQLSVFAGGFTLEAAEEVLDLPEDAPWALEVVQSLHERSLLTSAGAPPRFGMFESVRAYAVARGESGVQAQHAHYYAQMGEPDALSALETHGAEDRVTSLLLEADNLRTAAEWALREDSVLAVPLIHALVALLQRTGPVQAAVDWVRRGLALTNLDELARDKLSVLAGSALRSAGDPGAAEALTLGLERARRSGDDALLSKALLGSAGLEWEQGRLKSCEALLDEVLAMGGHGDGRALSMRGLLALQRGDLTFAAEAYEAALAIFQEAGNVRQQGVILGNLAIIADDSGDPVAAEKLYRRGRRAFQRARDRGAEANLLNNHSALHADRGQNAKARALQELALGLVKRSGDRRTAAVILGTSGALALDEGDYVGALERLEQALAGHRALGNRRFEGVAFAHLGSVHLALGAFDRAEEALRQALVLHGEVQDPAWQAVDLVLLARLALRVGAPKAALRDAERAVELASDRHAQTLAEALVVRAEARALHGLPGAVEDADRALAVFEEAEMIQEVAGAMLGRSRVAFAMGEPAGEWVSKARTIMDGLGVSSDGPLAREFRRTEALVAHSVGDAR